MIAYPPCSSQASRYTAEARNPRAVILMNVKHIGLVSLYVAAALLAACSKTNIDNQEALRSAMVDYLVKNQSSIGIDPNAMDVKIDAATFEGDTAHATVGFLIKGTDQGMHGNYSFTRQGDKWGDVKRQGAMAGPHGGDTSGADPATNPHGGGAPPSAAPSGQEPLLPVPLPGQQNSQQPLPAGHPPINTK